MTPLEDRFEVLKEIGDGSFGSVVVARVRTAGANIARRGTLVLTLIQTDYYGTKELMKYFLIRWLSKQ